MILKNHFETAPSAVRCSFSFLNLTKAERLDIMKTKGDTVTCSQAPEDHMLEIS